MASTNMLRDNPEEINEKPANSGNTRLPRLPRGLSARDKAVLLARWWADHELEATQKWVDDGCDPTDRLRDNAAVCWLMRPRPVSFTSWVVGSIVNDYFASATHAYPMPREYVHRITGLRRAAAFATQAGENGPDFVYEVARRRCGLNDPLPN